MGATPLPDFRETAYNRDLHVIHHLIAMAVRNAADVVYPRLCVVCETPAHQGSSWLCAQCIETLTHAARSRNACPRCSQNLSLRTCTCDIAWDYPFSRAFSLFDYDDSVKRIVSEFKYGGGKHLAAEMGRTFGGLLPAEITAHTDAIVPVPLHSRRHRKRDYNQAEYLARGIAAAAGRQHLVRTDLLMRKRHTGTQTKLDKEHRRANLQGAFAVRAGATNAIQGMRIVLVDDVVTTGATTGQCAQALRSAGAAEVVVVSLARD